MGNIKKQTYLQAALVLMFANLTVRSIGAIFKIPIIKLLGDIGFAYYQDAYSLYALFFAVSTAGLPVAISRMISITDQNKNYEEEKKIFKIAFLSFVTIGAVGSAAMIFGARTYSSFIANENAYYSILMLAPTLFFICITSAYRGYFQGRHNMIPTAISEIIEALCKLFIGIAAALYSINIYGSKRPDITAAFAISGLTAGSLLGAAYLYIKKIMTKRVEKEKSGITKVKKNSDILKEIIKISIPIMLTSAVANLTGVIDSFMMKRRLMAIGWEQNTAIGTYGQYTGLAVPFFNLPNTLVVAFAVSIIPVISAAFDQKNTNLVKSTIESTFRVVSMIAAPCAFGLFCFAKPILNLIYPEKAEAVAATFPMLTILGIGVFFVSMMTVTNSMLQAQNQEKKTVISMACGMFVKFVLSYILIGIPELNKFGTPISTVFCCFTIMCLNFYFLNKYSNIRLPVRQAFLKPLFSGICMSVCSVFTYIFLNNVLNGSKIAFIAALAVAVFTYFIFIIIFKTLTKDDVLLLPKGDKLYEFMKKKKIIN